MVERRTRDRNFSGSSPGMSGGRFFFSIVNFLCWLSFRRPFHIRVTAVASKIQYNITLLPSVNTLIARGLFCGARYTHHTFTPVIKHLITTTANKHPCKKSFIPRPFRQRCRRQLITAMHSRTTTVASYKFSDTVNWCMVLWCIQNVCGDGSSFKWHQPGNNHR